MGGIIPTFIACMLFAHIFDFHVETPQYPEPFHDRDPTEKSQCDFLQDFCKDYYENKGRDAEPDHDNEGNDGDHSD